MPHAFLSYSHVDCAFAETLRKALSRHGVTVWFDDHALRIGDRLARRIAEAIEAVDHVVVLVSPASLESQWIDREVGFGLRRERKLGKPVVLPILVGGSELPRGIRNRTYADFRTVGSTRKAMPRLLRTMGVADVVEITSPMSRHVRFDRSCPDRRDSDATDLIEPGDRIRRGEALYWYKETVDYESGITEWWSHPAEFDCEIFEIAIPNDGPVNWMDVVMYVRSLSENVQSDNA